jgi:hypothetical protein
MVVENIVKPALVCFHNDCAGYIPGELDDIASGAR